MKKIITIPFTLICSFIILGAGVQSDNGKAGYTGSPGESNCTTCHNSYAANTGGGSIYLTTNIVNAQYIPGQTYSINVTVKKIGLGLFGFGTEILQGGNNAGSIVITDPIKTQVKTKTVNGVIRNNVVQMFDGGLAADSAVFTFDWTAPATNIGNITIYFAGAACDADQTETGDFVYTDSLVITPLNTSVKEIENYLSLTVHPNPVTDILNLNYQVTQASMVKAQIISIDGKIAKILFNEMQQPGSKSKSISLEGSLPKGNYLIQIDSKDGRVTKKVTLK